MNNNKPVFTQRYGSIEAAAFDNSTDKGPRLNITVSRSYRDEQGNWQGAQQLWHNRSTLGGSGRELNCVECFWFLRVILAEVILDQSAQFKIILPGIENV